MTENKKLIGEIFFVSPHYLGTRYRDTQPPYAVSEQLNKEDKIQRILLDNTIKIGTDCDNLYLGDNGVLCAIKQQRKNGNIDWEVAFGKSREFYYTRILDILFMPKSLGIPSELSELIEKEGYTKVLELSDEVNRFMFSTSLSDSGR